MSDELIVPFIVGERMEELFRSYLLAIDEVNPFVEISFKMSNGNAYAIIDDILSLLIQAYKKGISDITIMLGYDLSVDVDRMYKAIYESIEGKTFEDRVHDHLANGDLKGLQSLAESEWHRVYIIAMEDGAEEYIQERDAGVVKTWFTVGDELVRETHAELHGVTIPIEEEFWTSDGDHASAPGRFRLAKNNAKCRCWIVFSAT